MSSNIRTFPKTFLAAISAVFITLLLAAPSFAHDEIIGTNPENEQQLDAAPTEIVLEYSNNLVELGNMVIVRDINDHDWAEGEVIVKNHTLTQKLQPDAPEGWYRVDWRAVSSDGHPITGTYVYLVGDNTDLPKPAPLEGTEEGHDHGHDHGEEADHDHGDEADHDHADTEEPEESSNNQMLIIGSLVVAGIGIGVAVVLMQSRKKKQ